MYSLPRKSKLNVNVKIPTHLFLTDVASAYVTGNENGFPAKASSTLVRARFNAGKLKHKSQSVSPARRLCKLSVFAFRKSFYK